MYATQMPIRRRSLRRSVSGAAHRPAELLAFAAGRDAVLHDLILVPVASCGAVAAGVRAGLMGILGIGAVASHQRGRQDAEFLAIHRRSMGLRMMLRVAAASASQGFQTMVGRAI